MARFTVVEDSEGNYSLLNIDLIGMIRDVYKRQVRAICANRGDSQQPLADVHSRKSGSVSGYRSREEPALIRRLDENPSFCRPTMLEEFDLAQALFRLFKRFVRPAEIFSFLR